MSRMIPGRIRAQGVELYDKNLVKIVEQKETTIKAKVAEHQVTYGNEDYLIACDCSIFASKKYCQHIAAIECYLKNDSVGKELDKQLINSKSENHNLPKKVNSFGRLFLEGLSFNEEDTIKYRLSAEGSLEPYSSHYLWTLKINRLPDERAYVIRDIKLFLTALRNEGNYQIGRRYFETLSLAQFDVASQELIWFLWKIIPDKDYSLIDYLLPNRARYLNLTSGFFEEGVLLLDKLHQFSFEYRAKDYFLADFRPLNPDEGLFHFQVKFTDHLIELSISEKPIYILFQNDYIFYQGIFYTLSLKQSKLLAALRTLPIEKDMKKHLYFNMEEKDQLATGLLAFQSLGIIDAPKEFVIRDFHPLFSFDQAESGDILLQLVFDYGHVQVTSRKEQASLNFSTDFKHEEQVFKCLEKNGFYPDFSSSRPALLEQDLFPFFSGTLAEFRKLGQVTLSDRLQNLFVFENANVLVSRKHSLLDISFDFSTVEEADIDEAMVALIEQKSYFITQKGQLVLFHENVQKIGKTLKKLSGRPLKKGHFGIANINAFRLSEALKKFDTVHFSEEFQQLAYDLLHPEEFQVDLPSINATLRDYQMIGFKWFSMLDSYGFGGILADDMGLGKTLQTIAFLSDKKRRHSKVLILSPSSLIYNWQDELSKFVPNLDSVVSYGLKSTRDAIIAENHAITITSYSSFRQDIESYAAYQFDYLILDEAQMIKNSQTKISQALRQFQVKNCFALSGTPIENKLLEIWSIFQVVFPGLLPTKKDFLKLDSKKVSRYVKPFILRRKKEDVLPELPELIEINYPNELNDEQKVIYLAQLNQIQDKVRQASDKELNRQKIDILSGITRLRQICNTPSLFMSYNGESGKIDSLRHLLLQIKENNHRVLIFSQFRGMLDMIEEELVNLEMSSFKLTGETPAKNRQEMTKNFNGGDKEAFLISLKAGGVGLNLSGADTVILVDLWWNPAVEMQAISRAHRIGQRENVEVYRLITRGTIEEKILSLQDSKRHLVNTVLDGQESRDSMSIAEIKEILGVES